MLSDRFIGTIEQLEQSVEISNPSHAYHGNTRRYNRLTRSIIATQLNVALAHDQGPAQRYKRHSITLFTVQPSTMSFTRTTTTLLRPTALSLRYMSTPTQPLVLSSRSPSNTVAILTLNRPKALNALSSPLFDTLNEELAKADEDESVKAIVLTGGEKVFAAGADIKEMKDKQCTSDLEL